MHVTIKEKAPGVWTLWATAGDTPDEAPILTASGRTAEQLTALLPVLLAQAPTAPVAAPEGPTLDDAMRTALQAVLDSLDGWIEGAQANHDGIGHRGELVGGECWRSFAPGDIRNMVNDAAREIGVAQFPYPSQPKEDAK